MTFHVGDKLQDGWGVSREITQVRVSDVDFVHPHFGLLTRSFGDLRAAFAKGWLVHVPVYNVKVRLPEGL